MSEKLSDEMKRTLYTVNRALGRELLDYDYTLTDKGRHFIEDFVTEIMKWPILRGEYNHTKGKKEIKESLEIIFGEDKSLSSDIFYHRFIEGILDGKTFVKTRVYQNKLNKRKAIQFIKNDLDRYCTDIDVYHLLLANYLKERGVALGLVDIKENGEEVTLKGYQSPR